jgi:hypothetical protein
MIKLPKALDGSLGAVAAAAPLRAIKEWTIDPQSPVQVTVGTTLAMAPAIDKMTLKSQASIGWLHLFRGFISMG